MNKRLYILVFSILFLGVVACQKIDIKPHTSCDEDRTEGTTKAYKSDGNDNSIIDDEEDEGDVITDPNNDEDEDKQIKQ